MDSQTKSQTIVSDTVAALKGIPTKEDLKFLLEQNVLVVDFTKLDGILAGSELVVHLFEKKTSIRTCISS